MKKLRPRTLSSSCSPGAQNTVYSDRVGVLHQRESKYDRLSSCLVDFKSRAVCASVKNFQIVQSEPEDPKQRPKFYAADGEGGALFDAHVGRVRAGEDARFKRPANRRG